MRNKNKILIVMAACLLEMRSADATTWDAITVDNVYGSFHVYDAEVSSFPNPASSMPAVDGNAAVVGGDASKYVADANGTNPKSVPIPAAAWLFGTALVGFVARVTRRQV